MKFQHLVVSRHEKALCSLEEKAKSRIQRRQIGPSGFRQLQRARTPDEQGPAEEAFQALDLLADRRLGYVQFLGGARETEMTRGGFEGAQPVQGRQSLFHELGIPGTWYPIGLMPRPAHHIIDLLVSLMQDCKIYRLPLACP